MLGSHSRCLNALTCHPERPLFLTCGDDTFLNVFSVGGDREDQVDVSLTLSSKVNDYMLVGAAFSGDTSIVAAPYDFKNLVVWSI